MKVSLCYAICLAALLGCLSASQAAENLSMRPGVSYYQDIDAGFPIVADRMDDVSMSATRPTLLFFGASGDLNTNRQARRLVDLYRKYRAQGVKFVVVDVDQPATSQARQLVRDHYRGYIPFQVLIDKSGQRVWSQIGEVEGKQIEQHLDRLLQSK